MLRFGLVGSRVGELGKEKTKKIKTKYYFLHQVLPLEGGLEGSSLLDDAEACLGDSGITQTINRKTPNGKI
jgi:hypothetical protein